LAQPQAGILPEPNRFALFLILQVPDAKTNGRAVARLAARILEMTHRQGKLYLQSKLVCITGFGSEFWDVVSPDKRPAGLRPFKSIAVEGRSAPNTGGDLLFHIISQRQDVNLELARQIRSALAGMVEIKEEVHGFRYFDKRDLTGFIDGTENPKGKERAEVALIGREDPEFAGGSYVYTQRYVHNLELWESVPRREQEKVIGRRKSDSTELSDRLKPPTAHISRVVIEEDGKELEIVRHSFPYGTTSEAGLFFIAYTKNLDICDKMLARMIGTSTDGHHDHLLHYTQAVSGATFFAPSLKTLTSFASSKRS